MEGASQSQALPEAEAGGLEEAEAADATDVPENLDIDLTDPEVENAAIKIQANFKGFKTRKELEEHKEVNRLVYVI